MGTGIFREGLLGKEEIPQKDIDYWCGLCQFPLDNVKCQTSESIQRCWNAVGVNAGVWHLLHECPFAHVGQKCRCNDFKTHQEAFASVGLVYREPEAE